MPEAAAIDTASDSLEHGLAAARAAQERDDPAAALAIYADLRLRFPDSALPFQRAAAALIRCVNPELAERLLEAARDRFPRDASVATDYAWVAHHRGDPAEAVRRWAALRAAFPGRLAGYLGGALALRGDARPDAAEALLRAAIERFPAQLGPTIADAWAVAERMEQTNEVAARLDAERPPAAAAAPPAPPAHDPEPIIARARAAQERRDWPEALRCWEQLRAQSPDQPLGYSGAIGALRQNGAPDAAETLAQAALALFPGNAGVAVEHARTAMARHDMAEAVRRWQDVREQFPEHWPGYVGGAQALRELHRFEEAEALLQAAIERFPAEASLLTEHAALAAIRRDWPEAARRWQLVIQRSPDRPAGYLGQAKALQEAAQFAEAETLLAAAVEKFPDQSAPRIEFAALAMRRRNWPEAVRRWEQVRDRFPEQLIAYTNGAIALRELHRLPEADALLAEAARRFPGAAPPLVERAWLAHAARDWAQAVQRWEAIRARFPDRIAAYTAAATALRELHREAEAMALLQAAAARFPEDPAPAIEVAWHSTRRRAWREAAQLWAELRQRFPGQPAGYLGAATALRALRRHDEAEAVLAEARQRFPDDPAPLVESAILAQIRRDWPEAIRRWAEVRTRMPGDLQAYLQPARALAESWRHSEAEALLADAVARFPDQPEPAAQFALVAFQQKRLDEAAARYAAMRERFPASPHGWFGGAQLLREQFKLAEADRLLLEAMERFPESPQLALDFARQPVAPLFKEAKNWPEALRRMAALRAKFPAFEPGWLRGIQFLRDAGQPEAAEGLAAEACERFPGSSELALEHARAAAARADWPEAIRRCGLVRERFPEEPAGQVGLARALAASGRVDEAEAALREAMAQFPGHSAPFAAHAQLAAERHDWPEALQRWSEAQRRFPEQKEFAHRAFDARVRLTERDPASHDPTAFAMLQAAPKPDPAQTDDAVSDLVMQFESLGGRGLGCEFGIFQRDCGAEPLGLLRWADMQYDKLVAALESRFDGVGSPENTILFLSSVGGGRAEYCTRDRRDMMFQRAFIYEDEIPFDKMFGQACRRLQYLANELIDDLEQGNKIFIFRLTDRNLTTEEIDRLHRAVRSYGDNTLLYVRYEDAAHPNGTVELAAPGLMIGYMDRFKVSPSGEISGSPPTASWLALCKAAYALWRSQTPAAPPPGG